MKQVIYYFLLLFGIFSCIPYKSYQKTDTICEVGMEFQEYEKTFDKEIKPREWEWQKIDSGSYFLSYVSYGKEGFTLVKWNKRDSISKYLKYDTLRRIMSVGYSYEDTYLSTSYFFDTLGNITKTIDERQADKYPICFREALEIVKRKTPKHYTIRTLERESMIIKDKNVYYWMVAIGKQEKLYWYVFYINAKTGKVFRKFKSKYAYD